MMESSGLNGKISIKNLLQFTFAEIILKRQVGLIGLSKVNGQVKKQQVFQTRRIQKPNLTKILNTALLYMAPEKVSL